MNPGDVISHTEMCMEEGFSLQRGMNYQVNGGISIVLMSTRPNAPYQDETQENGSVLIYEGHDAQSNWVEIPKLTDQPRLSPSGTITQNGKFEQAALEYKMGKREPEMVKVYEKIHKGIWVYNGLFELIDSWQEKQEHRSVFKFKMKLTNRNIRTSSKTSPIVQDLDHTRMIPTSVKLAVWKRDGGKCVQCGSKDNLHFDHILPFSKGGTSLKEENIQLLCARHNLSKSDKIQ